MNFLSRNKSLLNAARSGDRLSELKGLRVIVAKSITDAQAAGNFRDISPLASRLVDLGERIEALEEEQSRAEAESMPDEPFDPETI